jgi:autotransporter-associated beta strand protein
MSTTGAKSFTGTFVLNRGVGGSSNAGTLTVTNGSVASASEVVINGAVGGTGFAQLGGSLHAGNNSGVSANPGQRFTQNKITLNGGTLSHGGQRSDGSWSDVVQDDVSELDFNTGFNLVYVASGTLSGGTLLNVAMISRDEGATGYVRSSSLASTAKFVAGNGGSVLIGGGTGDNTTTMSIAPWLGASNTNGSAASPTGFATHTTDGFRALDIATEYAGSITAGATANVNTSSLALASNTTVNALRTTSGGVSNIGNGKTLTIASGGVYFSLNNAGIGVTSDADAGTLSFGSAEGVVWSVSTNTNTIGAVIDGSGGMTKTGIGTLVLTGDNTYTGDTHVSAGTLRVGNGSVESNLGVTGDVYVHNGALLDILSDDIINDANALHLLSYGLFNGKANVGDGLIEVVNALAMGDTLAGVGYYGSSAAYAANPGLQSEITINDAFFTGNGLVQVIPEPTSLALLAMAGGAVMRRRRR